MPDYFTTLRSKGLRKSFTIFRDTTFRNSNKTYDKNPRAVKYGTEIISLWAPKLWSAVPEEMFPLILTLRSTYAMTKSKLNELKIIMKMSGI